MSKTRLPPLTARKRKPAPAAPAPVLDQRILILAPTGNDARLTAVFLAKADLACHVCVDVTELCKEVRQGCGALLLAEETLESRSMLGLVRELARQPPWSDLPIVIITSGGEVNQGRLRRLGLFGSTGNVSLLERPFRPGTLVSAMQVALQSRLRQHQVRALLQNVSESEAKFRTLTSSAPVGIFLTDRKGAITFANESWSAMTGMKDEKALGKSWLQTVHPADRKRVAAGWREAVNQEIASNFEFRFLQPNGSVIWVQGNIVQSQNAAGELTGHIGSCADITERKHAELLAESQRVALQLIAEGAPLTQIAESLIRTMELQFTKKTFGMLLLLNKDGVHLGEGVAPSLPKAFLRAINGLTIGPLADSCGTAAYTKRAVCVGNISTDPRWVQHRQVALAFGLQACWSIPIISRHGHVLGTFALYHQVPLEPGEKDWILLENAARTASIAIERKLSEAAIQDSERRYSELVKGLPAAVYTTDQQGRVTLFNDAAVTLWGRIPEVGKDLWCGSYRLFRSDGTPLPLDQSPTAITLREGRTIRGEEIIIERPDGSRRNVVPYPDPVFNASGELVGAVNMLLDVTEARRTEKISRRLAAIVEFSEDAIVSKDLNGIVTSWNQGAGRLFGYRPEEIIGQPITILMTPDCWSEETKILERIRRGEHIEHYETVRRRQNGSLIEVSLTISPIKDANGKITGASKIARDITEQNQAKRDLERAHTELLAASRAKDDFLAALSHELRTPLNPALLLASEAAEDPSLPAPIREQFNIIRNSVELESRLIDDLLDITRISHGKLSLHMNAVDAHGVIKEAVGTIGAEIEGKRIVMTLNLTAENHCLKGDAVRLQQVFWNVLKNAAKFTPEFGKINVETRNDPDGRFVLAVTDSGIGMNEEELVRIFDAFTQGEHAKTGGGHQFGGLGLGLAISRMLVESHSGTIRASSPGRNQGSTFFITLPVAKKEFHATPPPGSGTEQEALANGVPAPLHILLVEDHEPTRKALEQLLTRRRHQVKAAGSVAEARELFAQNNFQLLISDIGLPDGNGFDLMKEFHARDHDLRGIALTGYGMEQDVARSEEAGFISHLTKPIRVQSLDLILSTMGDN